VGFKHIGETRDFCEKDLDYASPIENRFWASASRICQAEDAEFCMSHLSICNRFNKYCRDG